MKIRVKKGLDLPIAGKPEGAIQPLPTPKQISLNLNPFEETRFKVLVRLNDQVKIGQPLVESKTTPGLFFVSPAGGRVAEIRRGLKRRLLDIVIEVSEKEESLQHPPLQNPSKEEILDRLMVGGGFPHLRMRPFDLVASPHKLPQAIFVKAVESAPFVPPAELQVEGHEKEFAEGLRTLAKLATVHLVHHERSTYKAFINAENVQKHTVCGPHPAGNVSLHIHKIHPIRSHGDCVWTLTVQDVITIGHLISSGRYFTGRVIAIAGSGLLPGKSGFFKGRAGYPISDLARERLGEKLLCLISGNPLSGTKVEEENFLGFYDTVFSALPVSTKRQSLHFFRFGFGKFSATHAYISGFIKSKLYPFDTNQHGEERAFIDGAVYNKVMPMRIPTMQLVKAVLSEDYELAEQLGLLEVIPDDFALPTFICPSKIEMMDIIKQGLYRYSKELGF